MVLEHPTQVPGNPQHRCSAFQDIFKKVISRALQWNLKVAPVGIDGDLLQGRLVDGHSGEVNNSVMGRHHACARHYEE